MLTSVAWVWVVELFLALKASERGPLLFYTVKLLMYLGRKLGEKGLGQVAQLVGASS